MSTDLLATDYTLASNDAKTLIQTNPFVGYECVLKKCCKKYKKGKRCKKCPD
ncbi:MULTISPECIES: hypothetical protein [unclassified Spirosoma]|uniref:hypothetical protein n=1 Tax=unclassified Spirosoma TaxID=2621999 RepID=UPI000A9E066D|nr:MULTISPECIES: hypothetical protein [unclassified Spirosoma]MBN8825576.1 hypothetical protein [Spirosoma sp.]